MCLATVVKVRSCRCRIVSKVCGVVTGLGIPSACGGADGLPREATNKEITFLSAGVFEKCYENCLVLNNVTNDHYMFYQNR